MSDLIEESPEKYPEMFAWDEIAEIQERLEEWESGIHYDKNGNVWKLSEMSDSHLENTIRLFSRAGYNVNPLEIEKRLRAKENAQKD